VRREQFVVMRDRLQESIKEAFDESGIEIPFPQISINASTNATPVPLQMIPAPLPDAPSPAGNAPGDEKTAPS
jgi:small-conductance mechanosensitive channel